MPSKPNKITRNWVKVSKPFERERNADDFDYNGRKWRKLRSLFLENNPLCVMCDAKGVIEVANQVDHKVRVKDGGAGYDEDNFQALCKKCHASKSGRERWSGAGGMG